MTIEITRKEYKDNLSLYQEDEEYCEVRENKKGKSRVLELVIRKEYLLID